jgi:hypothetical protein
VSAASAGTPAIAGAAANIPAKANPDAPRMVGA